MVGSFIREIEEGYRDGDVDGIDENTALMTTSKSRFSPSMTKPKAKASTRTRCSSIDGTRTSFFLAIVVVSVVSAAVLLIFGCNEYFVLDDDDSSVLYATTTIRTVSTAANTNIAFGPPTVPDLVNATTTTTQYGEVWLIRHGEKDPVPPFFSENNINNYNYNQSSPRIQKMYGLNSRGWDRADFLCKLVRSEEWPRFHALFATRPATPQAVEASYPEFATDATGQSLVWREYQTLLPISRYLHQSIRTEFTKGDTKLGALEISKTAINATVVTTTATQGGGHDNDKTTKSDSKYSNESAVVLVSWDHCSLPTLVVEGFGCKNKECYRCWSDYRFGDVLKLNVSLTTVTTSSAQTFFVSSTILSMTGEGYPGDRYWYDNDSIKDDQDDTDHEKPVATALTSVSIEKATPCVPSYCTERPSAKYLVDCLCFDDGASSSASGW
eukprot:CAMPEP_0168216582 /NCGR_PEP_ID=MMETSP0140_2-20121125/6718_1 /TAXON_ID=44445 /ORGANISM="Pseudo-nitzschia australis, Strain 10249 10 AB" /LENGTH=440 /DNA_ID=CAMNT_0008144135 /DNA_START=57 /DNA_END=1376 /DNA_ORIENTATION=+